MNAVTVTLAAESESGSSSKDEGESEALEDSAILAPPPQHSSDALQLKGRIGLGLVCVSGGDGGSDVFENENPRLTCKTVDEEDWVLRWVG